jgi:hypothetical protein
MLRVLSLFGTTPYSDGPTHEVGPAVPHDELKFVLSRRMQIGGGKA